MSRAHDLLLAKKPRLGIDVGGVIMGGGDATKEGEDTSFFGPNYLLTPAIKDCFESVRALVAKFGSENTFIVSKAGPTTRARTLEWFAYHQFYGLTGFDQAHVHFCRKRHEKGRIAEDLGLTHFVDDRLEVLGYLTTVRHRYLFCPSSVEVEKHKVYLRDVKTVYAWPELLAEVNP